MMPNVFWDTEPADTIAFINAQGEERYNQSTGLATNIVAALGNALSKHPKRDIFPSYEKLIAKSILEEAKKQWTQEQKLDARVEQLRAQFVGSKSNT